jgi:SAM-dependent methyltransferase
MQDIFDAQLRELRAARGHQNPVTFIHDRCAEDVAERLSSINRSFKEVVVIGDHFDILKVALQHFQMNITAIQSTDVLPLEAAAHDLVISFLDLHHHNDPLGQLIQARRALKPDGLFLGVMFGGKTLHQLRQVFAVAEEKIEHGVSPRVSPMADIRDIGALLQRAEFKLPVIDSDTFDVSYQSPLHLMRDLRGMGETNIVLQRRKTFLRRSTLMELCATYPSENGGILATFEMLYLTGWVDHQSQQKPLQPGSAQVHLGDYLSTLK